MSSNNATLNTVISQVEWIERIVGDFLLSVSVFLLVFMQVIRLINQQILEALIFRKINSPKFDSEKKIKKNEELENLIRLIIK